MIVDSADKWWGRAAELEAENKVLREALEQYRKPSHWTCPDCVYFNAHQYHPQRFWIKTVEGYDLAREVLDQIDSV